MDKISSIKSYRETIDTITDCEPHVLICAGTGCIANGAKLIAEAFQKSFEEHGLKGAVTFGIKKTGCHGFCENGPLVVIKKTDVLYLKVKLKDVPEIVEKSVIGDEIVQSLTYRDITTGEFISRYNEIPFYRNQTRIALRNIGSIDPISFDDYIKKGGYEGLELSLKTDPDKVIETVDKSGLRGRGGAGFPTGKKWRSSKSVKSDSYYVICNGDEGDPGAFMDRSIMEGDPFSVIEGMTIGAYAVGARKGYIYVRDEYPLAVDHLQKAILTAREKGLLGEGILGTDFTFDLKISRGGGAFVCGESSALMHSIEGRVGEPRAKYIRSAEKGLYEKPTVLNNVETWANVPIIMVKGADWYASCGSKGSKGTKVFSLVGKINNTGLVEVPMGVTLRDLVEKIGGGVLNGKPLKAVQTGGPSGGCIPAALMDTPIDFDSLWDVGSMMGSGGIIVMDENTCMVDVAKYFISFLAQESCGKCLPCRDGLPLMQKILSDITEGKGKNGDIEKLEELCEVLTHTALCGLGNSAPYPVRSTIKYFRDEYEEHILNKRCPAGVCKELITYRIDADACTGCMVCAKKCPQHCIAGEKKTAHSIDAAACIKCGMCMDACKFNAVKVA
ncbi:MAG: NADH-quinone oxidoreductase subunit NuoF [Spirochaetes bacterium]|nr:MAG: NADH-quinone oxidoreductase subunit NuoF [Spirochaetota bacterium]